MKARFLVMVGFLSLLAVAPAFGQDPATLSVDIPFQFHVGERVLPPGQYTFARHVGEPYIKVSRPYQTSALALVITRTARELHAALAQAHIVFDRLGNTYYLSGLCIPGEDGYVLHSTKEKHPRELINVSR